MRPRCFQNAPSHRNSTGVTITVASTQFPVSEAVVELRLRGGGNARPLRGVQGIVRRRQGGAVGLHVQVGLHPLARRPRHPLPNKIQVDAERAVFRARTIQNLAGRVLDRTLQVPCKLRAQAPILLHEAADGVKLNVPDNVKVDRDVAAKNGHRNEQS